MGTGMLRARRGEGEMKGGRMGRTWLTVVAAVFDYAV